MHVHKVLTVIFCFLEDVKDLFAGHVPFLFLFFFEGGLSDSLGSLKCAFGTLFL